MESIFPKAYLVSNTIHPIQVVLVLSYLTPCPPQIPLRTFYQNSQIKKKKNNYIVQIINKKNQQQGLKLTNQIKQNKINNLIDNGSWFNKFQFQKYTNFCVLGSKSLKIYRELIQKQFLYPDPKVYYIRGEITKAILRDKGCESSIGSFFDVNHAFVVFEFSTGEWVRTEVAGFKNGTAIYITLIQNFQHQNYATFRCTQEGRGINTIIDWCIQFYKKGNFDIQKRNCYDFATFMLQDQFECGDVYAKRWKIRQLNKVWNILKD
ncbi:hypothetical protein pb186bvf_013266 [Paramecium bursaria]